MKIEMYNKEQEKKNKLIDAIVMLLMSNTKPSEIASMLHCPEGFVRQIKKNTEIFTI